MNASTQHGLARLLATVDVRAASLPASAILLVRRLADPQPRTLRPSEYELRPPPVWERGLQLQIDRAARAAVRPALGAVPASADAVVFRDAAELLACLARDFLAGGLQGRWWWEAWLRSSGSASLQVVIVAWAREPQWIPGALAALAATRDAIDFVAAIPAGDARHLFVAMAEAYEIPALLAPTSTHAVSETFTPARLDESEQAPSQEEQPQATIAALPPDIAAPWVRLLPSSAVPATLGLEQQTLLGVALALQRLPLIVRSWRFARAFHAWRWAETVRSTRTTPEAAALTKPVAGAAPNVSQVAARAMVDRTEPGAVRLPHDDAVQPVNAALDDPSVQQLSSVDAVAREQGELPTTPVRRERVKVGFSTTAAAPDSPSTDVPEPVDPAIVDRPPVLEVRASAATAELSPPVVPPHEPDAPEREAVTALHGRPHAAPEVVTNLGGVLFLLNVFRSLELFERLDGHFVVTAPIGGWAWLEIIARALIGRSDGAQEEGLWAALAALDGRPSGVPVLVDTGPLRTLRLPEDWPAMPDERRAVAGAAVLPLDLDPSPRLQQFLEVLVPYLRWRLLAAMGLDAADPVEARVLLLLRLLRRHGRLICTATHVDLHMDLDQIDIAVRLAGLDANPGWVPALGRVVTFHFEG